MQLVRALVVLLLLVAVASCGQVIINKNPDANTSDGHTDASGSASVACVLDQSKLNNCTL